MDVQGAVRHEPKQDDRGAVHQDCKQAFIGSAHENPGAGRAGRAGRTPVADALGLLLTRVEHGRDNHEPGRDRALANPQEEAAHEELSKRLRGGVTEQGDRPNEDVETGCAAGGVSARAGLGRAGGD